MEKNIGTSVGAIIKNTLGEYLAQYRLREPLGIALPAGHIDPGETPDQALARELLEETGLAVIAKKNVYHNVLANPCGKGHTHHEWWVYAVEVSGTPELKEPAKHRFLRFMPLDLIKEYVARGEYDPAWFDDIFPALGIIK